MRLSCWRFGRRLERISLVRRPMIYHLNRRGLARTALVVGLLLCGIRAAIGSLAFMLPGGAILGWTRLPIVQCQVCSPSRVVTRGSASLTVDEYAAILTGHLSLDAKVGQLFLVQFSGTQAGPDTAQMINSEAAGGVVLYADNIQSIAQMRALTAQLQQMASIPLIVSTDQEGGPVNRLLSIVGSLPATAGLTSPAAAKERGVQDARILQQIGVNLNLAPVIDVGSANPQLWDRTFGSNPEQVATLAGAYLAGLQQSGAVTGTLKHFPGLGSTTVDPHVGLPILSRTRTQWERIDLAPYQVLLQTHTVRAIMVTHELVPAVDKSMPASVSPALIRGVLRQELRFTGVVITDSLTMGALSARWTMPQAAVLAVAAGSDLLIGPYTPDTLAQSEAAVKQAVSQGMLSPAQIDQAVEHDLALKLRMHLIPMPQGASPVAPKPPVDTGMSGAVAAEMPRTPHD
ncbi:MAG: glycoside hydrolase family 3 [Chloroflexi bacterium]|nr:MAG: glycoside hydrolase family 3 [Chloroflexota bacterium]